MSITDSIADLLTLIRNASRAGKENVSVKASKLGAEVLKILKNEEFITNFKKVEYKNQGLLRVQLKYDEEGVPAIVNLKKISKPGLRVYATKDEIPRVCGGLGVAVLSTSKGVLTDREARKLKVGGEVIMHAW